MLKIILSIICILLFTACSEKKNPTNTLQQLNTPKIGHLISTLAQEETGVIIDLRDDSIRYVPLSLAEKIPQENITALKKQNILYVIHDETFGGILFALKEQGIAISGSTEGIYYRVTKENNALQVSNIEHYLKEKKSRLKQGESMNVDIYQMLEGNWGYYFQSY